MDELLQQESLEFTPLEGEFDPALVAATIAGIGFPFQDEAYPTKFLISPDAPCRDFFQARRKENPQGNFPYLLIIEVTPSAIRLASPGPEYNAYAREFILWLTTHYRCAVVNESGTDLTAALAA